MAVLDGLTSDYDRATCLVNFLISRSTGEATKPEDFVELRKYFVAHPTLAELLPTWLVSQRDDKMYWNFIKQKFPSYAERRTFIWAELEPLLTQCEKATSAAEESGIEAKLKLLDSDTVDRMWTKTLRRVHQDPDGAITAARSLVESVCKHILDDLGELYDTKGDLPLLYKTVANRLHLSADQQQEQVFKQILGGCANVVNGFAALRNSHADAHGQGRKPIVAGKRHALLATNLGGAMAMFLVETFQARKDAKQIASAPTNTVT